jgi:hypothetical protein
MSMGSAPEGIPSLGLIDIGISFLCLKRLVKLKAHSA